MVTGDSPDGILLIKIPEGDPAQPITTLDHHRPHRHQKRWPCSVSNGKLKGRGNKRNGNKYLAWAFMEAAHYAAIWSPEIKRFYQKRQAKRHILVAKKTVANKLAKASYHMLKRQEPFDVNRAFG